MKKCIAVLMLVLCSFLYAGDTFSSGVLNRKVEGLAIGELSLAYRLISLSVSLAIEDAVDPTAISSLLDNVDNTLANGRRFLTAEPNPTSFMKEVGGAMEKLQSCSALAKNYVKQKNYDNLSKLRSCMEISERNILRLSDTFNAAEATKEQPKEAVKKEQNNKAASEETKNK